MSVINAISSLYMNKNAAYDEAYFFDNHVRWINFLGGFLPKIYYSYVAEYAMARPARLHKNERVLDIGCGIGILASRFNKMGYQATGVDVNEEAIKNSIDRENCMLVDTTSELDFPDDYFDLTVSREVLEHIPEEEIDKCIEEWDRVTKGKMVHIIAVSERGPSATDDPAHVNVQSEDWWVNKFKQHGYSAVRKPQSFFFSPFGNEGYLFFSKR